MFIKRSYIIWVLLLFTVVVNSCTSKQKLFTQLPSKKTNITFTNNVVNTPDLNYLDYLYFYNGGGVATGDINNDGLIDIYFTANSKGNNKLYLNKGNFVFEDITASAGVQGISDWCTGVTMVDVNADGLLDIYVCAVAGKLNLTGKNQLYINKGNNSFEDQAQKFGLDFSGYSTQAAFFDYDKDGDLDCYLLNQSMHSVETYGDTSLRNKINEQSGDRLYKNENGVFKNVSASTGIYSSAIGYGLGIAIGDLNNDGWDDIYVGNDFHENDYYYINNKNGGFIESGAKAFAHYSRFSMGNDVADFNNDGLLDVFTTDMLPAEEKYLKTYASDEQPDIYNYKIIQNGFQHQYSRNCLQKNTGNKFSEVALINNVAATDWSWAPLMADYDNDGIKDLFITNGIVKRAADLDYIKYTSNGNVKQQLSKSRSIDEDVLSNMPDGKVHNYIFKGTTTEKFEDKSTDWGMDVPSYSNGSSYADLDNDGDLDLIVNNINSEGFVYKNNTNNKNFVQFNCSNMPLNTKGIGTKIYVYTNGKMQLQQLQTSRGFESGVAPVFTFGLDSSKTIDSVLIIWPSNKYQTLYKLNANKNYTINYLQAKDSFLYLNYFPLVTSLFTNITAQANINFVHKENVFSDFNAQYFIPHQLSTQGPKIAVADINNDGLEDFYICGAKNNLGKLFIQNSNASFKDISNALKLDSLTEQTNALFFDANNDGFKDLYIVSGGNEKEGNLPELKDHLFINKQNGTFEEIALPNFYGNKSVVAAADIDADGDEDLFVGGRCVANNYGAIPNSYILLNDGKANFTMDTVTFGSSIKNIGMVTDAKFTDINNDAKPDLIICGEWMPITMLLNTNNTSFTKQQNNNETGWWQSLNIIDVNNDGYKDIIAGNYGQNTKLSTPVKMYLSDLDNNGITDQILTYTNKDGNEYTFLAKDELEKQLPYLKKEYLLYKDFAGKTVQQIFKNKLDKATVLQANTFSSSYYINNKKNELIKNDFPSQMQYAPMFTATPFNNNASMLFGGNFFGTLPYEGNYDAMPPGIFNWSNTSSIQKDVVLNTIIGEIRDIKTIQLANKKIGVLIARNNAALILLQH